MQEKDPFRRLDELLAKKDYEQLTAAERRLLDELEYSEEMYALLRRQRLTLEKGALPAPALPPGLRAAVKARRRSSLLTYPVPAWQAAAALVLWLGIQSLLWKPQSMTAPAPAPTIICQTDTVYLEKIIKDTIRLLIQAPAVFPDTGSPAIAYDSLPREKEAAVKGVTLKDRPELKRFFTETF